MAHFRCLADYNIQQIMHPLLVVKHRRGGHAPVSPADGSYFVAPPDHQWPGTDFMPSVGGHEIQVTAPTTIWKGSGMLEVKSADVNSAAVVDQ